MRKPDRLLLVGMMGSGKSTVAAIVAGTMGITCIDTDAEIEAAEGRSVGEIFGEGGEAAFRSLEREVVLAALTAEPPTIVALGGGAVLDPVSRSRVRQAGIVVWLHASVATLADRVGDVRSRPLLSGDPPGDPFGDPVGVLATIARERREIYVDLSDVILDVDSRSPEEVAVAVIAAASVRGFQASSP